MIARIIIGLIIVIVLIGLFIWKRKLKENNNVNHDKKVKKSKLTENPYLGLRTQAINVTPDQLQLQLDNDNEIFGIVMDWNMGNAIATVVSYMTGDASVYLSTGQAFIGGYAHETVSNAAKQFILVGKEYLLYAQRVETFAPTNEKKVDFYFLTKSGKYYIEDDFAKIENNSSSILSLFEVGNQIITEYRLLNDKK